MTDSVIVKCIFTTARNNGLEAKAFPFKSTNVPPTLQQLKDFIKGSCSQLIKDDEFELMYLGTASFSLLIIQSFLQRIDVINVLILKLLQDNDNDKVAMRTDTELQLAWREMQITGIVDH